MKVIKLGLKGDPERILELICDLVLEENMTREAKKDPQHISYGSISFSGQTSKAIMNY